MDEHILFREILQGLHDDSILKAMLEELYKQPLIELNEKLLSPEADAGIYCLYYTGNTNTLYNGISAEFPIYIGKASRHEEDEKKRKSSLYKRISEHRSSICMVEKNSCIDPRRSIRLCDFRMRYLSLSHTMTAGCETLLIAYYRPLWNVLITGFGKHSPGKTRSPESALWDLLHIGRWCKEMTEEMQSKVDILMEQVMKWCEINHFMPRPTLRKPIDISELYPNLIGMK